jgi:hypothetical protein
MIDDGTGKDHDPHGIPGSTYGGLVTWSGGIEKTAKFPDGKPNGVGLVDGLIVWMKDPNRDLFKVSQAQGATVKNSYFAGGPKQVRWVTVHGNAGPVDWRPFTPDGPAILEEHGVPQKYLDALMLPELRLNDTVLGPADASYNLN